MANQDNAANFTSAECVIGNVHDDHHRGRCSLVTERVSEEADLERRGTVCNKNLE